MEHALARRPQKQRISDEGRDEQRGLQGKETDHVRPPPLRRGSNTAGPPNAGSDTSRPIYPLVKIAQDTGGDAPDGKPPIKQPGIMPPGALSVAGVAVVGFWGQQ